MSGLQVWPAAPKLAVACSGGADSLALALLSADWVRRRGGSLVALTVDHGLRAESAAEALQVGTWLRVRGVTHHVLTWRGRKPAGNRAAVARAARYRLLADWCRQAGCDGLLVAHQQEDQAETLLLRLGRGSGLDGLAGMAPVSERQGLRLLRPLLGVPRARLEATLRALGQSWVEDPSNADPAYARNRIRKLLPLLAAEGLTAARLAATAGRLAGTRDTLAQLTDRLLAEAARFDPAGYCLLDIAVLAERPAELSRRALVLVLGSVGGLGLPPRFDRLARLQAELLQGRLGGGRTLAGCRLLPWRGRVLVCREPSAVAPAIQIGRTEAVLWDNRFQVSLAGDDRPPALAVGALGADGWRRIRPDLSPTNRALVPGAVRPSLPALFDLDGVLAVPHLAYKRGPGSVYLTAAFCPPR